MSRQRAISYLEGLFLKLLKDMARSNKILNDREIEGKHKSRQKGTGRKRRLDDEEGSDDDDVEEHTEGNKRVIGAEQVGITLRLKSRTTG